MKNITYNRKTRRKRRVSENMFGTNIRPRIVVFRSNRYIYAQAIDDQLRSTVAASSSMGLKMKKSEAAKQVGVELAKKLVEKKVTHGIFDRSVYTYLGRVKSLAEGLREGGLII